MNQILEEGEINNKITKFNSNKYINNKKIRTRNKQNYQHLNKLLKGNIRLNPPPPPLPLSHQLIINKSLNYILIRLKLKDSSEVKKVYDMIEV